MFGNLFEKYHEDNQPKPQQAIDYVLKASQHMITGQNDIALQELNQAIQIDEACADAYASRASVLMNKGLMTQAFRDIHRALRLNPEPHDKTWYALAAFIKLHFGDWQQAINDSAIVLATSGLGVMSYSLAIASRVWACIQIGDNTWPLSMEVYVDLLKQRAKTQPKLLEAAPLACIIRDLGTEVYLLSKAYSDMQKGDIRAANTSFTEAIQLNPQNAYTFCRRGICFGLQGNLSRAMQDFSEAISVDSYFPDGYFYRGVIYRMVDNDNKSKTDFNSYVEVGGAKAFLAEQEIMRIITMFKQ